jgi:hypothetical protein
MMFPGLIIGFLFLIPGIILFIWGLYSFKWKRLIENIPTSKIRSIAMGLVEIFGEVIPVKGQILKSPFSRKDCVYYRYHIEELRSSGKNTQWVTVKKGEEIRYFYLKDETGMVLINPAKAKIDIPKDNVFDSKMGKDPPATALPFLYANQVSYEGFLFKINKTMRYTEYFIAPGDKLFIIGTADDNPFVKEGSAEIGNYDIMIKKGKHDKIYYISDKSEKKILFWVNVKTYVGFILGALFIILGIIGFTWV